jgi:hypothetical protein
MSIEYKFQTVVLQYEDVQEQFPDIISMVNSHLPQKKIYRKRKPRKNRETVSDLINALIDSIDSGCG